ncbi:MAG TPA: nucleoside 2-deoxyribosyltransferase [Candidatus Eisenbacteria bacterium]|nr:nucleoside 2-deoxyribosyltransferase [Candidatus Eisenbacteria bacterium]
MAGGSGERENVIRPILDALRARGIAITHDWTTDEGYVRPPSQSESRESARKDLDGVRAADLVWIVAPAEKSEGAGVELGAALALRKRVLVSGPHARRNIFALLAEVHDSHASAFEEVLGAAFAFSAPSPVVGSAP